MQTLLKLASQGFRMPLLGVSVSGMDSAPRLPLFPQPQQPHQPTWRCCCADVLVHAGRPRGFGFVVFESPEVVKKVIESKHTIDKRDVECKVAVPKEEVPTPASGADASTKTRKIFVGGLAPTVDDQVCTAAVWMCLLGAWLGWLCACIVLTSAAPLQD